MTNDSDFILLLKVIMKFKFSCCLYEKKNTISVKLEQNKSSAQSQTTLSK